MKCEATWIPNHYVYHTFQSKCKITKSIQWALVVRCSRKDWSLSLCMHVMYCAAALWVICDQNNHWQQLYMFHHSPFCAHCPFGSTVDVIRHFPSSCRVTPDSEALLNSLETKGVQSLLSWCGLVVSCLLYLLLAQVYLDTCSHWDKQSSTCAELVDYLIMLLPKLVNSYLGSLWWAHTLEVIH